MPTWDTGKICQVQHNHYFSYPDLEKPFIVLLKEVAITKQKLDNKAIET
ncbi:MAG: hypothetical protein V3W17_08285 [Desulfobacteria bacterium]